MDGIAAYESHVKGQPVVVAGDFNDNPLWDGDYPGPSFASHFDGLREKHGLVSAYHRFYGEQHGKESRFTLFHQRNRRKAYHIDYVLIPQEGLPKLSSVTVGEPDDWLEPSDHMPVLVSLEG